MAEIRFHFVTGEHTPDAPAGAGILAEALTRQGRSPWLHECTVGVEVPEPAGPELYQVHILRDEARLADFAVLSNLDTRSLLVVNTERTGREVHKALGQSVYSITAVNAGEIAETEGAPLMAALLGAVARAVPPIDADTLASVIWAAFDCSLPYAAQAAVRAFDVAFAKGRAAR